MCKSALLLVATLLGYSAFSQMLIPDTVRAFVNARVNDTVQVDQLNALATAYLNRRPETARAIAARSMDEAQRIKYTRGYARALNVMGNSYWYEGVYEFAQNYYLLAARQYVAINDRNGLGKIYNNIGEVYKKLKEYDKALEYLVQSLELKLNDPASQAITLYNIGELYVKQGKFEQARKYIDESLEWGKEHGDVRVIAYNYWSLGAIETAQKNYNRALWHYQESEKMWASLDEVRPLIQTYQDLSEIYRLQGKYSEANSYILNALQKSKEVKVQDLEVDNYLRYSRLLTLQGKYQEALYYLSRHNTLKDSVYNLLKAEQIARLQTIYETERREQENQQLRIERSIREEQFKTREITIITISIGLLLSGVLATLLYRQRKKILLQKDAIEGQAVALVKLNEELQEFNKTLEARIEQRTSQLVEQNQQLTEFTFINAHRLRGPVASILGLVNLIDAVNPDEKDVVIDHIKQAAEQLDQTLHQVSANLEKAIVKEQKNDH